MRKPIHDPLIRGKETAKRKDKDSYQFSGFYSPTQKQDALIKKSMIDRALCRSPPAKISYCQEKQNSTRDSLDNSKKDKDILFRQNSSNDIECFDRSFKKKKLSG